MKKVIVFFVDSCIIQGEIPFKVIKTRLPVNQIKVKYYFDSFQKAGDKRLIRISNNKMRNLNQINSHLQEGIFVSRDRDINKLKKNWKYIEEELVPNLHLLRIKLSGRAWRQEMDQVESDYYNKEKVDPKKVRLIRKEMQSKIIRSCEEILSTSSI
ncbi:MAG: hypothetical protein V5A57_01025 [Candidatus Paceibacterota bacterium]